MLKANCQSPLKGEWRRWPVLKDAWKAVQALGGMLREENLLWFVRGQKVGAGVQRRWLINSGEVTGLHCSHSGPRPDWSPSGELPISQDSQRRKKGQPCNHLKQIVISLVLYFFCCKVVRVSRKEKKIHWNCATNRWYLIVEKRMWVFYWACPLDSSLKRHTVVSTSGMTGFLCVFQGELQVRSPG